MNIQNESERARDLQARCNMTHIDRITDALTNSLSREKMLRKLNWIEIKTQLELYYLETKNEETRIILEHFDKYYKNL